MLETEKKNGFATTYLHLQGPLACWLKTDLRVLLSNNDDSAIIKSEDKPTEVSILRILEGAMGFTEYDREEIADFESRITIDLDGMLDLNLSDRIKNGDHVEKFVDGGVEYITDVNWVVEIHGDKEIIAELNERLKRPLFFLGLGMDHLMPSSPYYCEII